MNITRKDYVLFILRLIPLVTILFVFTDIIGILFVGDDYTIRTEFRCKVILFLAALGSSFLFCRDVLRCPIRMMAYVGYPLYLLVMVAVGVFSASHNLLGYKIGLTLAPCVAQLFAKRAKGWLRSYLRLVSNATDGHITSLKGLLLMGGTLLFGLGLIVGVHALRGMFHMNLQPNEPKSIAVAPKPKKPNYDPTRSDRRDPYRNYPKLFNDLNDVQLVAALANGTKRTLTMEELEEGEYKLSHIETNSLYKVDPLTHSAPYLVPKAAAFLDDLGDAFQDSLYNRGYDRRHRFIVTSVYRTENHIKRLQRSGNVNASKNSCHQYGTTIDITYVRFDKPEEHCANDPKLLQLLMQTVYDMHQAGRCYVKYERKQSCLHITVR